RQLHVNRTARPRRSQAHAPSRADRYARRVSRNPQTGYLLPPSARSDLLPPRERRADHAAAQSARIFELGRLSRLWRTRELRELFVDPDLSPSRSTHALPLLQLRRKGAVAVPQVPERTHLFPGRRFRESGRGATPRAPQSQDRPPG